jgi:hypothetical protein
MQRTFGFGKGEATLDVLAELLTTLQTEYAGQPVKLKIETYLNGQVHRVKVQSDGKFAERKRSSAPVGP